MTSPLFLPPWSWKPLFSWLALGVLIRASVSFWMDFCVFHWGGSTNLMLLHPLPLRWEL